MTAREGQKFLVQKFLLQKFLLQKFLLIERGDHGFGALLVRGRKRRVFRGVHIENALRRPLMRNVTLNKMRLPLASSH